MAEMTRLLHGCGLIHISNGSRYKIIHANEYSTDAGEDVQTK